MNPPPPPPHILPYLFVNSSNDGRPDPHPYDETSVEVLVQEEGLDHSCHKEEDSIEVAIPVWLRLVLSECDHQSEEERGEREGEWEGERKGERREGEGERRGRGGGGED